MTQPGTHSRGICQDQQEGRGYLLAHVERVRKHSADGEILAAPPGDVALGNHSRQFCRRSLPRVYVGLPVVAATSAISDDGTRRLRAVQPAAPQPAAPERRIGKTDGGARAIY